MKKLIGNILALTFVFSVCLYSFSASACPLYPDLTKEYLETFGPGSGPEIIAETSIGSEIVRIYDGKTGKFLYAASREGRSDSMTLSDYMILKEAMQYWTDNIK